MTWAPGIPAPATLWPVGERIRATKWDDTPLEGTVHRHATDFSLELELAPGRTCLVPTSRIDGAAERLAEHLADQALG